MTYVSRIFHLWIDAMVTQLNPLVKWPDQGMIQTSLPECFKPLYCRITCIIDCSRFFIQSVLAEAYSCMNIM